VERMPSGQAGSYAGSLQASGMLPFGQRGPVATLEETSKRSSVMNADLQDW